jgi:hypothetical protein
MPVDGIPPYVQAPPITICGGNLVTNQATPPGSSSFSTPSGAKLSPVYPYPGQQDIQNLNDNRYDYDTGTRQMPVAGPPGTPSQIVQLYAPTSSRTTLYTAESIGGANSYGGPIPNLPKMGVDGGNTVLTSWVVQPASPTTDAEGNLLRNRVTVQMTYRHVYPIPTQLDGTPAAPLSGGMSPILNTAQYQNAVQPSNFVAGIADAP